MSHVLRRKVWTSLPMCLRCSSWIGTQPNQIEWFCCDSVRDLVFVDCGTLMGSAGSRRWLLTLAILIIMLCTISSFTSLRPGSIGVYQRLELPRRAHVLSALLMTSSAHHQERGGISNSEEERMTLDPLIVCGPSGAGKGTIIQKFMAERGGSDMFQFVVSHTTRLPRQGEIEGVHYHFVSVETMLELIQQNSFLESAKVHGNYYGTSWSAMRAIQSTGRRSLLDIDVQGVKRIKDITSSPQGGEVGEPPAEQQISSSTSYLSSLSLPPTSAASSNMLELRPKYVFIAPPSLEALKDRLVGRQSESEESLRRRVANAASELEYGLNPGNFDAVVVNDELERAIVEFERAVRRLYDIPDDAV